MATQPGTGFALTLERTIAAPPEKVFDAFTQAETLARWFAPSDEYQCIVLALEAHVGGRYRFELKHSGGNRHIVGGVFEEVTRPTRLAYTFKWEDNPDFGESRVTVQLEKTATGSKLMLIQEQLPTAEARDAHTHGWVGSLDRLVRIF